MPLEHEESATHAEAQTLSSNHIPVFIQETQRTSAYTERIQTVLRENKQVLVLCPDAYALKAIHEALSTRMSNAAVLAYGGTRSKKKTKEVLVALQDEKTPAVIVGTRSVLFLPFQNLGLVVVDGAGNTGYETWGRTPRYHAVEVAEKLAQLHRAQLIYGDFMPSIPLWQKIKSCTIQEFTRYALSVTRCEVIDMRRETHWSSRHPISLQLKDALHRTVRGDRLHEPNNDIRVRKQAIILINRKGVATAFVCRKCGYIPRCGVCEAAMVLHGAEVFSKTVAGVLRCHHCGASQEPPKQCPKCGSYRIWPIGAGTVQIERDIKNIVPEARVLRIDSDVVKSEKELLLRTQAFRNHEADILVGTQLMLKDAMLPKAALSVVLGAEQLFVFPEYNAAERAWRMLETLRQKTTEQMIIQTLDADMPMLKYFVESDFEKFLAVELEQRKAFGYPPFGELVKLTFAHAHHGRALYEAQRLAHFLESRIKNLESGAESAYILGPSPAFIQKERGKWKFVILLKFTEDTPLEKRNIVLEMVPPSWQVEVNPRELL